MKLTNIENIAAQYDTDKSSSVAHMALYSRLFERYRNVEPIVLELGIFRGGSLRLWNEYFPRGLICGIDLVLPVLDTEPRIRMYGGAQDDSSLLARVREESAPSGFDIVIDDGAHIGLISMRSVSTYLRDHLKPGGIYIIEDWGTGYWPDWPDGQVYASPRIGSNRIKSHDYGMVGLAKELIDHVGRADIAKSSDENSMLPIEKIEFYPGIIVLFKNDSPP